MVLRNTLREMLRRLSVVPDRGQYVNVRILRLLGMRKGIITQADAVAMPERLERWTVQMGA